MLFPTCGIFPSFNFQLLGQWPKISNGFVFLGLLWCCGKICKSCKEDTKMMKTHCTRLHSSSYKVLCRRVWRSFINMSLFRWHINKYFNLSVDHQTKLSHWHTYTAYKKALLFYETKVQSSAQAGIAHLRVQDLIFCAYLFVQLINWKLEVCSYWSVTLESFWMIFQCTAWYI